MPTRTAANIALALFALFGVLGFGWRSWIQYRRTGSTGFRGISGRPTDWIAGVGFVIALVVAVAAPILQRANIIEPIGSLRMFWVQVAGIAVATAGIAATVYAQLAMGDSWRIGVDEQETTTLVTPNLMAFAGFILLVATIELQVRLVEEPHLLRTHGAAYRTYAAGVGRFIPRVGLIR